jgi:hypothetical protein
LSTDARQSTGPKPARLHSKVWAVVVVLWVVELAWLGWVLNETLPNARAAGESMRRSYLLWRFFPEVVPGVPWRESFLGLAAKELSHVENLPQRIPIVVAGGFILLSGLAVGSLVLRGIGLRRWPPLERMVVAYGIGMTGLGLLALVSGRFGWLNPWTARIGLFAPIAAEGLLRVRNRRRKANEFDPVRLRESGGVSRASVVGLGLVVAPFLVAMSLGAMLPTIDFDAIEYHLEAPKEYFLTGRIGFLPHNVYASMPFSIEMLHLIGMNVVNDWWRGALVGQLLVASFAPMAGLAIWLTARRWGSPRAAWVATAVYLTTPWIYRLAAIPYVEGPLCYYHAALVWSAGMAWGASPESRSRWWFAIGLLAGGAMAIKYPALISAVLPFGVVALAAAWRVKSSRIVIAFSLGVLMVMGPWLVKNVVDTGNPVYPLGYRVFGGRDWDDTREAKWENAHGRKSIEAGAFISAIVDVAGRSDWQSPALAALAPLALLRRGSRRVVGLIGGYVVYLFLTWWLLTHRLDRFWLPLIPGLAVLAGLGADWTRSKAWTALLGFILTVTIAANFAYCSTALAGLNEWTGDLLQMRTGVPTMLNPPLARLDAELPIGAKPLLVGQAAVFHLTHAVVYNTVFDRESFESIDRDRSPDEVRAELARRGITHIYVDWHEIERYRAPGNYGFTDYVTLDRFDRLVRAGVLSEPRSLGTYQSLYTVK